LLNLCKWMMKCLELLQLLQQHLLELMRQPLATSNLLPQNYPLQT
jgi:hypothetical protein